ncbi:hypothetical protein GCM10025867_37340 [Frondihabitans sucicola]|uniref:Large extracellular alpha-helical protein n=1 Tax=Frondihabitans sucicola TaxID=1268041 RepID=A0ABM8GT69_9MICO|nr:DUF5719 family protein [Frondihabitans sucicola]BDZ51493.1 hypothetical protein GCM10025867_37340 [Frondihabitans sucicola]
MTRRKYVSTGVRAAIGVVTLAIGAGVIAAATALPLPSFSETPAGRVVTPVALDQQRVCSGSLLRLAGQSGDSATSVSATGSASTVTGAGDGDAPEVSTLKGPGGTRSKPLLITAAAKGSTTVPLVAGAQSQDAQSTDLTGFAASPCSEPTSSSWLVGGSTETGRTTLIDLVNPTDVNSTVDLAVYGESGKVNGPGLEGIVVAPNSEKAVPLSGFATGLASPVVHVTSRGGQITANLQVGVVRTLEPGGADTVSAAAGPSKRQTIPGIIVRDSDAVTSKSGQDGYDDLTTILRAFVPGTGNADLTIQLRTPTGNGATFSVTAQAGQVTDVPLDGLPNGQYTATIAASVPVVAGVRSSSVSKGGAIDLAWVGAAPALAGSTMLAVAQGPDATLTLANPTTKAISARLQSIGGTPTTLTVPAGASLTQKLSTGSVGTLTKANGLRAAVSYSASGRIAAYALFSPTAVSTPVKVYP